MVNLALFEIDPTQKDLFYLKLAGEPNFVMIARTAEFFVNGIPVGLASLLLWLIEKTTTIKVRLGHTECYDLVTKVEFFRE